MRLLGVRPTGQGLLHQWRKAALTVVHTGEPGTDTAYDELESRVAALYGLLAESLQRARHDERSNRVIRWK